MKQMNANDKYKHYSAADIREYLRGDLSAREMQALEAAALEDPFLADALEGMEKDHLLRGEEPLPGRPCGAERKDECPDFGKCKRQGGRHAPFILRHGK